MSQSNTFTSAFTNSDYEEAFIVDGADFDPSDAGILTTDPTELAAYNATLDAFPSEGYLVLDAELSWLTPIKAGRTADPTAFDAQVTNFIALYNHAKGRKPNLQIGFYGLPIRLRDGNLQDAEWSTNIITDMASLWSTVDVLFPSAYDSNRSNHTQDLAWLKTQMEKSLQVHSVVMPFYWSRAPSGATNGNQWELNSVSRIEDQLNVCLNARSGSTKIENFVLWDADLFWHSIIGNTKNPSYNAARDAVFIAEGSASYTSAEFQNKNTAATLSTIRSLFMTTLYTGLIGAWELNEQVNENRNDSHNRYHMDHSGPVQGNGTSDGTGLGPGGIDCLDISGTESNHNNTVRIPSSVEFGVDTGPDFSFTIEVKMVGTGITQRIIYKQAGSTGLSVYVAGATDKVNVWVSGAVRLTAANAITPNVWHSLTITSDSTGMALYTDGTLSASTGTATALTHASTQEAVFGSTNTGGQNINGLLCRARLWNRGLTTAEVATVSAGVNYLDMAPARPVTLNKQQAITRLAAGECYTNISSDSLFNPSAGDRMWGGFLRKFHYPLRGVYIDERQSTGNPRTGAFGSIIRRDGSGYAATMAITAASYSPPHATITVPTGAPDFLVGDSINVSGVADNGYNNQPNIQPFPVTAVTATDITYDVSTNPTPPAGASSGGTVIAIINDPDHAPRFSGLANNPAKIVLHPIFENVYSADMNNALSLGRFTLGLDTTENYTDWRQNSWVLSPGSMMRFLYYDHLNTPASFRVRHYNSETAPAAVDITPSTTEGIKSVDLSIERSDMPTYNTNFSTRVGIEYATDASGTDIAGKGLIPLGVRAYNPTLTGNELTVTAYGGSPITGHMGTTNVTAANRAKWVELLELDTFIIWFNETDNDPYTVSSNMETLAQDWEDAVDTAITNGGANRVPLIIVVATWENDPSKNPMVYFQYNAIHSMVEQHATRTLTNFTTLPFTFVNMTKIVENKHGPWADWQATLTEDGLHPSTDGTGADEFASLFFSQLGSGGVALRTVTIM